MILFDRRSSKYQGQCRQKKKKYMNVKHCEGSDLMRLLVM